MCTPPLCAYKTGGFAVTGAKNTDGVLKDGTFTLGFGPMPTMSQSVLGLCGERTAPARRSVSEERRRPRLMTGAPRRAALTARCDLAAGSVRRRQPGSAASRQAGPIGVVR